MRNNIHAFGSDEALRLLFGDLFHTMNNAVLRSGTAPLKFLFTYLAVNDDATATELTSAWSRTQEVPVDHAMIEVMLVVSMRLRKSAWFRARVVMAFTEARSLAA